MIDLRDSKQKILFFDGFCSLCNGVVDWGIRNDKRKQIQFASLQGETALKFLANSSYLKDIDTVVYFREGLIYERSDAILFFLKDLGIFNSGVMLLIFVPRWIRDFFYRILARNRFLFFKKRNTCRIPTANEKDRLLK